MGKYAIHQSDANEPDLRRYMEAHGAQIEKIHRPVDWLVAFRGATGIAEVKTTHGRPNASQRAFLAYWRGVSAVLRTTEDCDAFLERLSRR